MKKARIPVASVVGRIASTLRSLNTSLLRSEHAFCIMEARMGVEDSVDI